MFEEFPIVDVLNTGVSGFAVVMMYFTYRLLARAQNVITDVRPKEFESVQFYESWCNGVRAPLVYVRYFMILTGFVFFGSLALLIWDPENRIIVSVVPSESNLLPELQYQGHVLSFSETGSLPLNVKANQDILIKASKLVQEIQNRNLEIENLKNQLQAFTAVATSEINSKETAF